jgi:AcrR family transcriptional regulator
VFVILLSTYAGRMERAAPVSRRNRPAKPALSQESIVDAALAILDADGLDAVSMRRVAQALDTGPASLYVYVANRDELLALLLDRVAAEVRLPGPDDGRPWRERLVDLALEAISVMGRHRRISLTVFANVPTGPNALSVGEAMIALLAEAGIGRQAQAWAVDMLSLYIAAAATEDSLYRESGPGDLRKNTVASTVRDAFAALSPQRFPHFSDLYPELTYGTSQQRTRWALDAMINGILATQDIPRPPG